MDSINFTGFRINLIKMFVCCSYSLGVTVNKRVSAAPPPPTKGTVAQPLCVTRHTTCDRLLPSACRRPYVRPAIDSAKKVCGVAPRSITPARPITAPNPKPSPLPPPKPTILTQFWHSSIIHWFVQMLNRPCVGGGDLGGVAECAAGVTL